MINPVITNVKMDERLSFRDALGDIYIAIAEETIDTGGQRAALPVLIGSRPSSVSASPANGPPSPLAQNP